MEQEVSFNDYLSQVNSRIANLSDEEKKMVSAFTETPEAQLLGKVLGPEMIQGISSAQDNIPTEATTPMPTGLGSPTTPTEIPAEAAAPVAAAPVRKGLPARPMQ